MPSKETVFLYFATIVANLMIFSGVVTFAWTSPCIPQLNGQKNPAQNPLHYNISATEESLLASIYLGGAVIAPFMAGPLIETIGCRYTIIIFTIPTVICFLMKAFATHIATFCVARFLGGLTGGSMYILLALYSAEISEAHNRGLLSSLGGALGTSGNLFTYTVGSYLSIKWFSLSGIVAPTVMIIVMLLFIPESPYFYVRKNREEDALKSLRKFRHKTEEQLLEEIQEIRKTIEDSNQGKEDLKTIISSPVFRKGLFITTVTAVLQQLSGVYPVLIYLHTIFYEAGTQMSPEVSSMIIGGMKLAAFLVSLIAVERFGRRFLLIQSGFGITISFVALGLYFYLKQHDVDVSNLTWMPLTTLLGFVLFYNSGLGFIPLVQMGEMFPQNSKSIACIILVTIAAVFSFLVTFSFPLLVSQIGMGWYFWIVSLSGLACVVFTYFFVPETKGKTLLEIQKMLQK